MTETQLIRRIISTALILGFAAANRPIKPTQIKPQPSVTPMPLRTAEPKIKCIRDKELGLICVRLRKTYQ